MMAARQMQLQTPSSSSSSSFPKQSARIPSRSSSVVPNPNPNHIPGVPVEIKEKVLCLEIMGVDAGKALAQNPSLRHVTLDSVNSVVTFLRSKAGLLPDDLPKVVGMCPSILTLDVIRDLAPALRFLTGDLRVPTHRLRRAVAKNPRLLAVSVTDQLRPALHFLRRLGFTDDDALAHRHSVLLVSSVENTLLPKLGFLEAALGITRPEAVAMVLRCPALFTFSVENNFRPKFEYLTKVMGRSAAELMEFPQYFAFSLENRIKVRHCEAVRRGVCDRVPLPLLLKTTDQEFAELLDSLTRPDDSNNNNTALLS